MVMMAFINVSIAQTRTISGRVTDKETGEILGAQMVGPRASDLVHEVAVAMKGEMLVDDLSTTIHSHPTLSEVVMEAAEDCFGMATHKS